MNSDNKTTSPVLVCDVFDIDTVYDEPLKSSQDFEMSRTDSKHQSIGSIWGIRTKSHWERFAPSFSNSSRSGSVLSSVFTLVSMILGGGVLSIPYAFNQTGLILGLFLLIVFGLAADYSIFTLIACSRRADVHKYEGEISFFLSHI